MRRQIPGRTTRIRLFERVATVDPQYDIFDVGFEHENGDIDSIAVGGSFAAAKRWVHDFDEASKAKQVKADLIANAPELKPGDPIEPLVSKETKVVVKAAEAVA